MSQHDHNPRSYILDQPDVHRLHHLIPEAMGRWLYLIETPFETFPRYVIGSCAADGSAVRLELRCGRYDTAMDEWERRLQSR